MDCLTKKISKLLLILITLTTLGCSVDTTNEDDVINAYIKATYSYDYKTAYSLLSDNDKTNVSFEEFSEGDSFVSQYIARFTKYSIINKTFSDTKLTVTYTVLVNYVDLLTLYEKVPTLTKPNTTNKELKKILSAHKNVFDLCRKSNQTRFTLISDGRQWQVDGNLANIKYNKQLRSLVLAYEKTGDFDQALEVIDRIYSQNAITEQMTNAYIRINDKKNYIEHDIHIQKVFSENSAKINITNGGTYAVKEMDVVISYIRDGQTVTSTQSMQLRNSDFLGHGQVYTFAVDFGTSIMHISKLDVRIINIVF